MANILVLFHCESNPGYAASSHELTFLQVAKNIVGSYNNIHFAYKTIENGKSQSLPDELRNIIKFDSTSKDINHLKQVSNYIRKNNITILFGFDQAVHRTSYRYIRNAGIKAFISYWGAPMSSINTGWRLMAKKIQTSISIHKPNHFIFQSEGMRKTATNGCGIPFKKTSIVRTGIDTERYAPAKGECLYAHEAFNIPKERKIIFFSGHMEARKGVTVIIDIARHLIEAKNQTNVHFLLLGNRNGQEKPFEEQYHNSITEEHITFGGYRNDIPEILKSCHIGLIASTGWDSFPMSSIEMAASKIPIIVSDIDGLREAITPETGFTYPAGDFIMASNRIEELLNDDQLHKSMGNAARERAVKQFSKQTQVDGIEHIIRKVMNKKL